MSVVVTEVDNFGKCAFRDFNDGAEFWVLRFGVSPEHRALQSLPCYQARRGPVATEDVVVSGLGVRHYERSVVRDDDFPAILYIIHHIGSNDHQVALGRYAIGQKACVSLVTNHLFSYVFDLN
jgi:hypothetical protein